MQVLVREDQMVDINPLLKFALARYGVIRRADALRFVTSDQLRRITKRGLLKKAAHGVYVVTSAPLCWEQQVRIAAWSFPEAQIACESAARLWGLRVASQSSKIVLNAPHSARGRVRTCEVRNVRVMTARQTIDGLAVDCIERVLIDIAGRVNVKKLTVYVSDAFHLGLTTIAKIERTMDSLPTNTPGFAALRAELATRTATDEGTRSRFEQKVLARLRKAGLPEPATQFALPHSTRYYADFCWVEEKVAVEVDGPHHLHPEQVKYDRLRRNAFISEGYSDLHFGDETNVDEFIGQLETLLKRNRSGLRDKNVG